MKVTQSTGIRGLFNAYSTTLCEAKEDAKKEAPSYDVKKITAAVKAAIANDEKLSTGMPSKFKLELSEAPDKFSEKSEEISIDPAEVKEIGIIFKTIKYTYTTAWAPIGDDVIIVVVNLKYSYTHTNRGSNGSNLRIEFILDSNYNVTEINFN